MKDEIIDIFNKIIEACEPIKYEDFNKTIRGKPGKLEEIEKQDDRIGIRLMNYDDPDEGYGISTLSLFATLTDICLTERLAFTVDDDGYIIGVQWYQKELI